MRTCLSAGNAAPGLCRAALSCPAVAQGKLEPGELWLSQASLCAQRPYKSKVCGGTDNESLLISHKFSAKCTITKLIMQCRA